MTAGSAQKPPSAAFREALEAALLRESHVAAGAAAVAEWDWHFRSAEYETSTRAYLERCHPARAVQAVEADRRVLKRHRPRARIGYPTDACEEHLRFDWPCPDVRDLAARYGVALTTTDEETTR